MAIIKNPDMYQDINVRIIKVMFVIEMLIILLIMRPMVNRLVFMKRSLDMNPDIDVLIGILLMMKHLYQDINLGKAVQIIQIMEGNDNDK